MAPLISIEGNCKGYRCVWISKLVPCLHFIWKEEGFCPHSTKLKVGEQNCAMYFKGGHEWCMRFSHCLPRNINSPEVGMEVEWTFVSCVALWPLLPQDPSFHWTSGSSACSVTSFSEKRSNAPSSGERILENILYYIWMHSKVNVRTRGILQPRRFYH